MKPTSLITAMGLASWALLLGLLLIGQVGTEAQQKHQAAGRASRSDEAGLLAARVRPSSNKQEQKAGKSERAAQSGNSSSPAGGRPESLVEDELPPDFYEVPPEQLDLGMNATGTAPTPILHVAVLQNGQIIDSAVTVHPGTPLEMVIYLDDKSAKVYGLQASFLKVKDDTPRQREETIILNGCSIDTYIFGNFEHNSEDQSLWAKFRAFKFPESNFVRFIGTVNVCIKQCAKLNCGPNSTSPQRRRRRSAASNDRLVQLTVNTVLKIGNSKQTT